MDRTVLTLAVDSTQVGTAAAAFERLVNTGNAAAASGGKVAATILAQSRSLSQNLVPALNRGALGMRTLADTQRTLSIDATRQATMRYTPVRPRDAGNAPAAPGFASGASPAIQGATTGRAAPIALPGAGAGLGQVPTTAAAAQGAIDRLTSSARSSRTALLQLSPAAEAAARNLRQLNATQIRLAVPQGASTLASVLAAAARANPNPSRQVAAALQAIADQAARAATNVAQANRAIAGAPRGGLTMPGTPPRAPLTAAQIVSGATGQRVPTTAGFSTSEMTIEARRAESAVERLTAAARNQHNVLVQLAPTITTTAAAYRELAAAQRQAGRPSGAPNIPGPGRPAPGPRPPAGPRPTPNRGPQGGGGPTPGAPLYRPDQIQQLSFQVNDLFVQIASGGSALTALIQQGSQLSGTFGGARPAFQAVLSLLTPMRIAAGGAATAVGALGYAFYEGARQSKAFADAVVLTGNYAGQTQGNLTALTREIASHGQVTATAAREAAQAAIISGQVGPKVFAQATEAIALYAQATDQTAADVAKDFANMAQSPSKWAEEHNRVLHFITAAQYDSIKAFEDGGKAADAQGVIYAALNERLKKLDPNLGTIERSLRSVKGAWASFWDAAYDIGRTETIENKIASLDSKIRSARTDNNPFAPAPQSRTAQLAKANQAGQPSDEYALQDLLMGKARQDADAANEATDKEIQKAGIAAKAVVDGYLKRGKAASAYNDALEKLNRSFKDQQLAGTPVSAADQKVALAELKKEFTAAKGRAGTEASQVLAAQLQGDLRSVNAIFQEQRDAYQFQNAFVESAYRGGTISLQTLMQQRREALEGGTKAELDSLDKEAASLQEYLKKTKDPSERTHTKARIEEIGIRREQVDLQGQRDIVMLNQEEADSLRALSEQVTNYRANLLQLAGDEAGAAALRAQSANVAAKLLAAQSGGQISEADVARQARLTASQDAYNEVQRQTSILASNSARAEEAYLLAAEQGGKSLLETERGIFALRSEELNQLGALASKAKELAEASDNPALKTFAADLALSYAKAANAIDPALNRLREAQRELAGGLANTAGGAPNALIQAYASQRQASSDDIKRQKDEYSRKIEMLEGYLAQTSDKNDKARLRERIKAEEAKRDSVKGESKGKSVLGAINDAVVQPMAKQVFETVNKLLITNPLETYLKGALGNLTEGKGALAGVFKDALGIKADPKEMAQQQQTAAITASSSALEVLTRAAQSAAAALGERSPASAALAAAGKESADRQRAVFDPSQPPPVDSELAGAQDEAADSALQFGRQAATATSDIARLASAAGVGGNAMAQLPTIVSLFQSAVAAMSTSGSGGGSGGIFGAIAGMFSSSGSGSGVASAGDYAAFDFLAAATGGYISGPGTGTSDSIPARLSNGEYVMPAAQTKLFRPVLEQMREGSLFENAPRYHTGGIAGRKADGVSDAFAKAAGRLKAGEIPAILMRNEEVLRADDPRHRDNLGGRVVERIMQAKGENSATVLQSLFGRLGVKDDGESAASKAFKVHGVRGARELGGPVSANSMYRVNERRPELLQVAGKQYLMTGTQGGNVVPNGGGGQDQRPIEVHQNFALPGPTSHASQSQVAAMARRGIERALRNT